MLLSKFTTMADFWYQHEFLWLPWQTWCNDTKIFMLISKFYKFNFSKIDSTISFQNLSIFDFEFQFLIFRFSIFWFFDFSIFDFQFLIFVFKSLNFLIFDFWFLIFLFLIFDFANYECEGNSFEKEMWWNMISMMKSPNFDVNIMMKNFLT